jgi:hypothetical protein
MAEKDDDVFDQYSDRLKPKPPTFFSSLSLFALFWSMSYFTMMQITLEAHLNRFTCSPYQQPQTRDRLPLSFLLVDLIRLALEPSRHAGVKSRLRAPTRHCRSFTDDPALMPSEGL